MNRMLGSLAACGALIGTAGAHAAAEIAAATQLPTVEVYAQSPVGPATGDGDRAPANLQRLDREALQEPATRGLADALQDLTGVFRTDATGNPFQPDLFYRGYSLSPLLGLPQGLSVYQDGVRINEAFGDTVNFDLVPIIALSRVDLVPGSNPVFGRNTLAGALALTTKSGFDAPGASVQLSGGSFGRGGAGVEYGVAGERSALYLASDFSEEQGWRDESRSRVLRAFGKLSFVPDDATQLDLSLSAADNRLRGNGAAPLELLDAEGRDAVFTYPDETQPDALFANLGASRVLAGGTRLSGTLYLRRNRTQTFNGDGTEFGACEDPSNVDALGQPLLCEAEDGEEEVVENTLGEDVTASADNDSATQNRSSTRQITKGLSVQADHDLGAHRLSAGLSFDTGDIRFDSSTELARLTDKRGTVGSGVFVEESIVDVNASNDGLGVYLMDRWRSRERLELTAAARWNYTRVELRDQIPGGDLSGEHEFRRLNPMLGFAYTLDPRTTAFGSLAQSTRAPTPVELTCANPDDPCRLPNGFVDDPPLDEVVTRTAELGLRHRAQQWSGSVALFHAVSDDDILFITDGDLTNQGYFDNVGKTLRQGVELALNLALGRGWSAGVQYTALIAEFREEFLVNTPNHPVRALDEDAPDESTREVEKGDRIPLIPRQQARATLGWQNPRFGFELEAVGRSSSRYRGDEANVDSEQLSGFVIVNAQAEWKPLPRLSVFATVENLFDRDYETFGVYGEGDEVLGDDFEDARRFVGAGAPTMFEAGLRLRF